MAGDRPRQPVYEIFSTEELNVDFSSPRPDPLNSRRPAQAGVEEGYPPKSGYFTAIGSCCVKMVADRYRHAAQAIVTSFLLSLTSMTLNDFEPPK